MCIYCKVPSKHPPSQRARKSNINGGGQIHGIAQSYCESAPWNQKQVGDMPFAIQQWLASSVGTCNLSCTFEASLSGIHSSTKTAISSSSDFHSLRQPSGPPLAYVGLYSGFRVSPVLFSQVHTVNLEGTSIASSSLLFALCLYVNMSTCKYEVAILTHCACADINFPSWREGAYTIPNLLDVINEGGTVTQVGAL